MTYVLPAAAAFLAAWALVGVLVVLVFERVYRVDASWGFLLTSLLLWAYPLSIMLRDRISPPPARHCGACSHYRGASTAERALCDIWPDGPPVPRVAPACSFFKDEKGDSPDADD